MQLLLQAAASRSASETWQVPSELAGKLDLHLGDFFRFHRHLIAHLQEFAGVPFVVKRRLTANTVSLVFEGRFLSSNLSAAHKPFPRNKPTWCLVLDRDWQVAKCSRKVSSIPKSHLLPRKTTDSSFAELVLGEEATSKGVPTDSALDPQSQPAAVKLLAEWGQTGRVNVNFCVALSPVKMAVAWIAARGPFPPSYSKQTFLELEAFTGAGNRLRFRSSVPQAKFGKKKKASQKPPEFAAEPTLQSNRASGMTVNLTGLSLALKLGLLSSDIREPGQVRLERLNAELGLSFAYFWIQRDEFDRVRLVTYLDGLYVPARSFKIAPGFLASGETGRKGPARIAEENVALEIERWESWKRFFDYVWERRGFLLWHKRRCVQLLLDSWGTKKEVGGGSQGRCLASLEACLSKVKLFCFSRDDSAIHAVKLFFARYCEEVRRSKTSVGLKTVGASKIYCLVNAEVDVENVSQFFLSSRSDADSKSDRLLPTDPDAAGVYKAWEDWCPNNVAPPDHEIQRNTSYFNLGPCREDSIEERGNVFVRLLAEMHSAFSVWLCRRFSLDLATSPFLSMSSLSLRVVMLDFWKKAGPTAHSLEKTKPSWEDSLRRLSKGGFSYSCRSTLASGEALYPEQEGSEDAVSVVEFDLKACYGYSLSTMAVPGSFGVGYAVSDSNRQQAIERDPLELCRLARTDVRNRSRSFEYLGVQAVISEALKSFGEEVVGVWSNYSPLGTWYVGKYPVDLAIVFEGRGIFLYQFDGQFAHGCPTGECRSLPRYVNDSSELEVLEATRKRNEHIEFWIRDHNYSERKLKVRYSVVNDCHDPELGCGKMFGMPELSALRRAYDTLPNAKRGLSFPADLLEADPELTFLLIGRGQIPEERRAEGMPLFVWGSDELGHLRQDFGFELEDQDYLFTRDSFEHLVKNRGFVFSSASACCFYKKCPFLPQVYAGLVSEREESAEAGNTTLANFFKCAVNFSTGMFGLKAGGGGGGGFGNGYRGGYTNGPSRVRLTSKMTPNFTNVLESVNVKLAGNVAGKDYYVARRVAPAAKRRRNNASLELLPLQSKRRKATNAAIPIYASVVEFGKLRLLRCLEFILDTVRLGSVRVLYSQVDNLVLGLAAESLEGVLEEARRPYFDFAVGEYFGEAPGKLVKKWLTTTAITEPTTVTAASAAETAATANFCATDSWHFASSRVCSYGVDSRDADGCSLSFGGHSKMSGLSGVSPREAYLSNARVLAGLSGLVFEQERRTNSLLNEDTVLRTIR